MSEDIGSQPTAEHREVSSNLYLTTLGKSWLEKRSFGDGARDVWEKSGRKHEIFGLENIPKEGPYIIAANHFVRVDDPTSMTGKQKMNDLVATVGLLNKIVAENTSAATVLWTPSETPRPEAAFPRGRSFAEIFKWFKSDAKFAGSNVVRKVFFSMFNYSMDVLMAPSSETNTRGFRKFYEGVTKHLREKGVLGIFPEGEISQEMRQAEPGVGHIAIKTKTSVLPVALYDDAGVLKLRVGAVIQPPDQLAGKTEFTTRVMGTIAGMLPESLRGFYIDKVPAPN